MQFEAAVEIVIEIEGGGKLVNRDPKADPGGLTRWGISLRSHPYLGESGIRSLTKSDAIWIYLTEYWPICDSSTLPGLLKLPLFDTAVHSGSERSVVLLQRALNAFGFKLVDDGVLGPITKRAIARMDHKELFKEYQYQRQIFLRNLSNYSQNAKGWEKRILTVTHEAKAT
ncbi:MAG: hypothetical protein EOP04_29795 [Proteobacteria bacterium]|nr:MAG: hypothetical protein EOP04_29795 [Pseudomonadota bacterium]